MAGKGTAREIVSRLQVAAKENPQLAPLLTEAASVIVTAVDTVWDFHVYDSVPDDHGYVGSGLEAKVRRLFEQLDIDLVPDNRPTPL